MATGGQQVRVLVLADELCDESDPIVPATREICRLLLHNGAHVWLPVLNRDEDKSFLPRNVCKAAEEIGRGFPDRLHLLGFKDGHFGKDKPSKEWICKHFKQHYAETLKNIGALTHVVVFVPRTIRAIVRLSDDLKDCRIVMIGIDDLTEKEEGFFSRWYEKCHAAYSLGESLYKYYQLLLQEKITHKRLFLSSSQEYFEKPINWDSLASSDIEIRLATFIPSDIPLPMHQDSSAFRCFTEMKDCFKTIVKNVRLLGHCTPPKWFIYCRNKAEHETEIKKQLCDEAIADYIRISESPWNVNGMVTTLRTSTICVFPEKSRCLNRIAQNAISLGLPTVVNMESGIGSTMKQAEITSDLVYIDGEKKLEYTLTPSMCNPQQLETLMKRAKEVHQQVRDSDIFSNTQTEFINEFFKGVVSMPPVLPPIITVTTDTSSSVTVSSAAASGVRPPIVRTMSFPLAVRDLPDGASAHFHHSPSDPGPFMELDINEDEDIWHIAQHIPRNESCEKLGEFLGLESHKTSQSLDSYAGQKYQCVQAAMDILMHWQRETCMQPDDGRRSVLRDALQKCGVVLTKKVEHK